MKTVVKVAFLAVMLFLVGSLSGMAQNTNGSITGTVKDEKGSVIPGASVTVVNPVTNTKQNVITNEDGIFIVPQLPPAAYSISVEKQGFKVTNKTDIVLTAFGKLNAGEFIMETGSISETVTVTTDSAETQLQTESGERSDVITNNQLRNLALNGRNTLDLLQTLPGFSGESQAGNSAGDEQKVNGPQAVFNGTNINGNRQSASYLTVDGATNRSGGGNVELSVTVNPDAIAEVKVQTSNFSAEFGSAGGAQISFVTRSGGNKYHGGARYFRRHDSMNANRFFNNASNPYIPRPLYRYNYYGYDFSGPLPFPNFGEGGPIFRSGKDKLFFFFNQEFYDQNKIPQNPSFIRVPTAAERSGDFSQTTNGNGVQVFIRDPNLAGLCQATPAVPVPGTNYQAACFRDASRATASNPLGLNIIPVNRFFRDGQAILNIYPLPNVSGNPSYNFLSQDFINYPRREDILRIDYHINESHHLSWRLINNADSQVRPFGGTFLGGSNFVSSYFYTKQPGYLTSFGLQSNLSPRIFNDFNFSLTRAEISLGAEDEVKASRGGNNITFPQIFPQSNQADYLPVFTYGAFTNQTLPTLGLQGLPWFSHNYQVNISNNVSVIHGNHLFKAGIQYQNSISQERPQLNGNVGNINFANNTANPQNTGHPFANALLGVYNSYAQGNNFEVLHRRSYNLVGFVQDTWKIKRNLTLDYGVRLLHYNPLYFKGIGSAFFPSRYDPARAVRLYVPVCLSSTSTPPAAACPSGANRRAVDPALLVPGFIPNAANTLSNTFIGQIVPNSGDRLNGIWQEKDGAPRGGFNNAPVLIAPRVGFAWQPFAKTVVRGGFGLSYDRIPGNAVYQQSTNPPNLTTVTLQNGLLADLNSGISQIPSPQSVNGYDQSGNVPVIYSYSLGVQRNLGWNTIIDVAYVGTSGRHLSQNRNLNAIPYLTTFQANAQDRTLYANSTVPTTEPNLPTVYSQAGYNFSGQNSLPANFLRPYKGYANINFYEFVGTLNYHSLQVSVNRRYGKNLQLGMAYTFSKTLTTASTDVASSHPFETRAYNYGLANYDRPHVFVVNYSYSLPNFSKYVGDNRVAKFFLDGFQFSGINRFQSGTPYSIGFAISGIGNSRLSGSPDLPLNFNLTSDPGVGNGGLLIDPSALVVPLPGDVGPKPFNYLRNPSYWTHDVSLFKNIYFSENRSRYLQLRVEAFNFINDTRFINVNSSTSVSTTDGSVDFSRYREFKANPTVRGSSTLPIGQFFGEPNGARAARVVQLGVKLYF